MWDNDTTLFLEMFIFRNVYSKIIQAIEIIGNGVKEK